MTPQSSYEEDMTATSLDVNFKEELSAIEQCVWSFNSLISGSDLYPRFQGSLRSRVHSLSLQPFTQMQIRLFVTVLQLMARADAKTALLSPAIGSSMESRMEGKLASMNLKSPGLESSNPSSPSACTSIPAPRTPSR